MQIDDSVLEEVPVNISRFRESWSGKFEEQFRKEILQNTDRETVQLIAELSGVDPEQTTNLYHDIRKNRTSATVLFAIHRFISGKKLSVRSLGNKRGDEVVNGTEYRYVLKQIVEGDDDFVYKVSVDHIVRLAISSNSTDFVSAMSG